MSNSRILKNSAFLYLRLLITLALGLFTMRIVINALGIDDYGIYGVVAGLITMFGFMNAAMSSSTQRYLAFNLGLKDSIKLQQTFTTAVNIHLLIALLSFLLAEAVGLWAINHLLDIPTDRLVAANKVFQYSLITFVFGIIQVPYHAATIAYERMNVYASISIIDSVLKLIAAYLLLVAPLDRLVFYSQLLAFISVLSFVLYFVYVQLQLTEIKYIKYFDKKYYQEILSFSGWNLFGNIAAVARGQGINIIINIFFGVALNAAYGVAMMIQGILTQFAASIQQAINPQIIKSYAQNDLKRTEELMHISSKYSFFVMLILITPFYLNLEYVLSLWLGAVPEYAATFIVYVMGIVLIEVLSNSLMIGMQSTGKIKAYQIIVGLLVFVNFPLVYLAYTISSEVELAFVILITMSIISLYARLVFVKLYLNFSIIKYHIKVIFRIIPIAILVAFVVFFGANYSLSTGFLKVVIDTIFFTLLIIASVYVLGLNKHERLYFKQLIKKIM